jgi:hypothetical protein
LTASQALSQLSYSPTLCEVGVYRTASVFVNIKMKKIKK